MTDERAPYSVMPPEFAEIGTALADQLRDLMLEAYHKAMALERGNPVERQNDALSILSTAAARAGCVFLAQFAMTQQMPLPIAWPLVLQDIQLGMMRELQEAEVTADAMLAAEAAAAQGRKPN